MIAVCQILITIISVLEKQTYEIIKEKTLVATVPYE